MCCNNVFIASTMSSKDKDRKRSNVDASPSKKSEIKKVKIQSDEPKSKVSLS